jgi:hypothetical protein
MAAEDGDFKEGISMELKSIVIPLETIITPEGTGTVFAVNGQDQKWIERAVEDLESMYGGEAIKLDSEEGSKEQQSSDGPNTFGFNSARWRSPWNPTGPKKNWGYNPAHDDSLN